MEFIEATLNPNFLPKRALNEVPRGRPKVKQNCNKKTEKSRKRADPTDARPPMHRRTGDRAPTHGRAAPAHGRAPPVHGRASMHGRPCASCAGFACFCLGCTAVHPCGTPVHSLVFLCFAILGAWGFLEPLIFLEIAREVFFSIKT